MWKPPSCPWRRAPLAVVAALAAAVPLPAQAPDPAPSHALDTLSLERPLPVDPALRRGILDNGLRFYIRENRRPRERVELRLVVNAGSVLEDDDQLGLAHVLEHMAFNGTDRFTGQELRDYLESIGMRFGPGVNASTGFDQTVYQLQIPLNVDGALESGFRILADWAGGQTLDAQEMEKERGVVIEEWRGGRGAFARVRDEQLPVLYRGSRYARRLPIGTLESLQTFDPHAVRRFYADWYRPDLMAVVVVGDLDADRAEALVRDHLGALAPRASPREVPRFDLPHHDEALVSIVTDPELPGTSVSVYHKGAANPGATVGHFRKSLVERLYVQMFNARLDEIRQRPDPPFLGAGSGRGRLTLSGDAYVLSARVAEDGAWRGLEALLTEAARVESHGFAASELEREKRNLLRSVERAFDERENAESRAFVGTYVDHFLVESPIPGVEAAYRLAQRFLPGIRLEEVNELARRWIHGGSRVVLLSGPEKEGVELPTEPQILALFRAMDQLRPEPWVDRVADAPLMTGRPRPGQTTAEDSIPEIGVVRWRLSNGARVVLKPTDFKEDEILFRAVSPGGHSLAPDDAWIPAVTAPDVVTAGGLGELDLVELRKALAGSAATVSAYISAKEEGLRGSASPKDLEALFQLVHLSFTAPRRDSTAFASLHGRLLESLRNRGASPQAAFFDTLGVVMSQGHPRAAPPSVELYGRMDLDASFEFYRDRFADAADFTFYFVGSFRPETLRPLVETYLASLPSLGREETWRDRGIRPPRGVVRKEVRRGAEEQARTQIVFTGPMSWDRRDAHLVSSLADLLRVRLRDALREEMGATYGVSVSGSIDRKPEERYTVGIGFAAAPDRMEELTVEVFRHLDRVKAEPPSPEEVSRIQEQQRRAREDALQQNGFWLGQLVAYDDLGRDPREILTYERDVIAALTPGDLQAMARRALDTDNFVRVSLYPEDVP